MTTQLIGESQMAGSIIGMFLDLTREAFRTNWSRMEDFLGVQHEAIGRECCNLNLLKETMGKIGELGVDGKVRYPINVSYDMGWQKAKKTYDSISGHGLMIGNATKNVVAFQNFSSACGFCSRNPKKQMATDTTTTVSDRDTVTVPVTDLVTVPAVTVTAPPCCRCHCHSPPCCRCHCHSPPSLQLSQSPSLQLSPMFLSLSLIP
jgi:hypothetical protein